MAKAGLGVDDVGLLVCHQSNIRIIEAAREKIGLRATKCLRTSSVTATVPPDPSGCVSIRCGRRALCRARNRSSWSRSAALE